MLIYVFLKKLSVRKLKLRELKKEDKSQIEFYNDLIDKQIKEYFKKKLVGFA